MEMKSPVCSLLLVVISWLPLVLGNRCPDKCFCSKKLTSVNCEGQGLTEVPVDTPSVVEKLYLDHNLINTLSSKSFRGLENLQYIALRSNKIVSVETDAFSNLPRLVELYLCGNMISELSPSAFNNTSNVRIINLSGNNLQSVPSFGQIVNLQELILEANHFVSVTFPPSYANIKNLGRISLSNSGIRVLNKTSFESLRNSGVRKLEIARNKIFNVSGNAFKALQAMESLKIGQNPLNAQSLELALKGLNRKHLKSLNIAELSLGGSLPSATFSLLTNSSITTLMMPNNKIIVLPSCGFKELGSLRTLSLSGCGIQTVPSDAFDGLTHLQILFLNGNEIIYIPTNLPPSLNKLYLNSNKITSIPGNAFVDLRDLKELYLGSNKILTMERNAFNGLYNLNTLHLDDNRLNPLPVDVFSPFASLSSLELNKNNIATIPDEPGLFSPMISLIYLSIADNQLKSLPLQSFNKLTSLNYLRLENNALGNLVAHDYMGSLFAGLHNLQELNLSNNDLYSLPEPIFRNLTKLKTLGLGQNRISKWELHTFKSTKSLKTVDLAHNMVAGVSSTSFRDLLSLRELKLAQNPFACNCDLRWFRDWMNTTSVHVVGNATYKCSSPPPWRGKFLLSFDKSKIDCRVYTIYEIVGALVGGMVVVFIMVTVLYRKRWYIRLRFYRISHRMTNRVHRDGYEPVRGNDKKYRAYISNAEEDNQWVLNHLLPGVDDGDNAGVMFGGQFKLYYDTRDYHRGKSDIANMLENMGASNKVLVILTNNYLKSSRLEFEIEQILQAKIEGSIEDFLFVKCDNLDPKQIPKSIRMYLEKGKFLEWENNEDAKEIFKERINHWLAEQCEYRASQV